MSIKNFGSVKSRILPLAGTGNIPSWLNKDQSLKTGYMAHPEIAGIITALIDKVEKLIPLYLQQEEERMKARGGIAICIIDQEGSVYGKMFGEDKIMARERYRTAWMKASQVWITGIRTGEFERLVYNGEIDEAAFGIKKPDYIGWEGGQPVHLPNGMVLAVGFSGLRSATDLEIVNRALQSES